MPRTGALLLIAAGLMLGVYDYLVPVSDTSTELAEITRISAAPDRDYRGDGVIRTFAPASSAFSEVIPDDGDGTVAVSPPKPGTWTTVVMSGQTVLSPLKSSRTADAQTRAQLARDLQHELQRASCYQGEITGIWNAATRRAMAAFMDRANAVLPFKEPDYVLLALVQNHQDITCAAECPSGQVMEDGGRCVPHAVIAQAAKRSKRLEERRLAEVRFAEDREQTATSETEMLPWLRDKARGPASTEVAAAPRPAPLQGRMSIGGPIDAASSASSDSASGASQWSAVPVTAEVRGDAASTIGTAAPASAKFAALQYDPDADDLSDDASTTPSDAPPVTADVNAEPHKSQKSRRSESDRKRRYNSYASAGRRRHGDPRPGTARYNLMQSLGGVY